MPANTAPQHHVLVVGEIRNAAVSFVGKLSSGEVLTGTPIVEEHTTTDLTISNVTVNSETLTINGRTALARQAVQFTVSGQKVGATYKIKITVSTSSSPAETLIGYVEFNGATE